jgi:uncharacterized protein YkwD
MMRFFGVLALFLTLSKSGISQISINKEEAKKAVDYLNKIRQNPAAYSSELGVDLSKVEPMQALEANPILMKVAEERAKDLIENHYFSHINKKGEGINILIHRAGYTLAPEMIKNKDANYFESISAGMPTGIEHINNLLIDEGINPPGHRIHLLGMNAFYAECRDIGIGFAEDPKSEFRYYMVVIIAKKQL